MTGNYGNKKARHLCWLTGIRTVICGARGGRTFTVLLPKDFKSFASADSAIAPAGIILPKKRIHALFFSAILKSLPRKYKCIAPPDTGDDKWSMTWINKTLKILIG